MTNHAPWGLRVEHLETVAGLTERRPRLSWRLPENRRGQESAHVEIKARAPSEPGSYIVEFDMVAEHIAWFEDFGSGTLRHELRVEAS